MRSVRGTGAITFVVGVVAVVIACALALGDTGLRAIGTDVTPTTTVVVTIPAGGQACQPLTLIARNAEALKLFIGPGSSPTQARLQTIQGVGVWHAVPSAGAAALALPTMQKRDTSETVCVDNRGPGSLALLGTATGPDLQARLSDASHTHGSGRIRIDSLASEQPVSALSMVWKLPARLTGATGSPLASWLVGFGSLLALIALIVLVSQPEEADEPR